jgi:hypothetical protein
MNPHATAGKHSLTSWGDSRTMATLETLTGFALRTAMLLTLAGVPALL